MSDAQQIPSLPERRARVRAAKADLGDFRRADHDHLDQGTPVDYTAWAHRLAWALEHLADCVDLREPAEIETVGMHDRSGDPDYSERDPEAAP